MFLDFPADFWLGLTMVGASGRLEDRRKPYCVFLLASGGVMSISSHSSCQQPSEGPAQLLAPALLSEMAGPVWAHSSI